MGLAEMFWGRDRQQALIDVQIFNTFVRSHRNTLLSQSYRKQEMKKKRVYEERIRKVEHGTFSSLVFTTAGGLGPAATVVYERLASGIAEKHNRPMGRCCTSSDADWTSLCWDLPLCVCAPPNQPHTVQPISWQGTSSIWQMLKAGSPMMTEQFTDYCARFITILRCLFLNSGSAHVCLCCKISSHSTCVGTAMGIVCTLVQLQA